jgi:tetratricopeptide (TPR) repeat protein
LRIYAGTGFGLAGPMLGMSSFSSFGFRVWFLATLLCLPGLAGGARAGSAGDAPASSPHEVAGGGSPAAVEALRAIVHRQREALAAAREKDDPSELEDLRPRLQRVLDDYERLVSAHPDFAAAWAAYGLFLCEPVIEDRKAALALLLKANALDGGLAVVKNQIGVILAEDGRPIDAFNYFLAAADLEPEEPLRHFQIGLVLAEGRADFLKSGAWPASVLDQSMLTAFARAATLAPERTDYAYRAAEAYYDLAEPRWEAAYAAWTALEQGLTGRLEVQVVRLHRARVLWKQGLAGDARELLETVSAAELAGQRARLEAEFAAEEEAEKRKAASGK